MRISKRIASSSPLATAAMHGRVEQMTFNGDELIDFSIAISHCAAPGPLRQDEGMAAIVAFGKQMSESGG